MDNPKYQIIFPRDMRLHLGHVYSTSPHNNTIKIKIIIIKTCPDFNSCMHLIKTIHASTKTWFWFKFSKASTCYITVNVRKEVWLLENYFQTIQQSMDYIAERDKFVTLYTHPCEGTRGVRVYPLVICTYLESWITRIKDQNCYGARLTKNYGNEKENSVLGQ